MLFRKLILNPEISRNRQEQFVGATEPCSLLLNPLCRHVELVLKAYLIMKNLPPTPVKVNRANFFHVGL